MDKWSHEQYPIPGGPETGLYGYVKGELEAFAKQNRNNRLGNIINFESILYTIQLLAGLHQDLEHSSYNNRLNPFISLNKLPEIQKWLGMDRATGEDLGNLQSLLVDQLVLHFRQICNDMRTEKMGNIDLQKSFLNKLNEHYQLGIINLNYDNMMLSSRPDLNTGFRDSDGSFDRYLLYAPTWNFCFHIHGSVHFDMRGGKDTEMHKIFWNKDLNSSFAQNSSGRNDFFSGEGDAYLTSSIIAGMGKSFQVQREPFGSYFMQLDRLIYEADKILFIGYGFNDMHLNNFIRFIRYDETKMRKVVILDYAEDKEDGLSFRHDTWSFGLSNTIPFNGREMRHKRFSEPQCAGYYRRRKTFERSINPKHPLSVWYNGYIEAMNNVDLILKELE